MITLVRGPDRIRVGTLSWAAQVFAWQVGWRPSGATGSADGMLRNIYGPGRKVGQGDANRLATALEEVVNGKHGDSGDLDLDGIALLVNFLRAGAFEIW